MEQTKITRHASHRSKERMGFDRAATERMALRALSIGLTRSDISGCLEAWVDRKIKNNQNKATNIRLYAGQMYVFHEQTLVTVYPIPGGLVMAFNKAYSRKASDAGT